MAAPTSDRGGIQQVIRGLRADGWSLDFVDDGEEDVPVTNETEAIEAIMAVDMAHLFVRKGEERGHVWFVLGNDPDEVAADYTLTLSATLDPLIERWISDSD